MICLLASMMIRRPLCLKVLHIFLEYVELRELIPIVWHSNLSINHRWFKLAVLCHRNFFLQKKQDPHRGRLISCGHSSPSHDGVFCIVSDGKMLIFTTGDCCVFLKPKKFRKESRETIAQNILNTYVNNFLASQAGPALAILAP